MNKYAPAVTLPAFRTPTLLLSFLFNVIRCALIKDLVAISSGPNSRAEATSGIASFDRPLAVFQLLFFASHENHLP